MDLQQLAGMRLDAALTGYILPRLVNVEKGLIVLLPKKFILIFPLNTSDMLNKCV